MQKKIEVLVFLVLLVLAWLMPNHYSPWLAFHSDWVACAAVVISFLFMICRKSSIRLPIVSLFLFTLSFIPIVQYFFGIIYFKGDALIVFLYVFIASLSSILGFNYSEKIENIYKYFALAVIFAGIISIWIALSQWLSVDSYGIYMVQIPFQGRVYANFAQPNQFATFLMLNLCSVFYLFKNKHINILTAFITVIIFCFGISLSQSRAGFLEVYVFCFIGFLFYRKKFNESIYFYITLFVFSLFWFLILPWLNEILTTSNIRLDKTAVGTRPVHWQTALHAISISPWKGYGWNQVSVALSQSVNFYPSSQEFLEHSHNLILDLILWNGIPLFLLIMIFICFWTYHFIIKNYNEIDNFPIFAIVCLLLHSMLEFPLDYAYFLIPFTFFLGSLEREKNYYYFKISLNFGKKLFIGFIFLGVLLSVARDYLIVENSVRLLRFEDRGLKVSTDDFNVDQIKLFDQQKNFIIFAKTLAKNDMSVEEIDWMKKVTDRYGYAPALFRYALATGLNGRPQEAINALRRICKTSSHKNCLESKENWEMLRLEHKDLPEYPQTIKSHSYPPFFQLP